MSSFISPEQTQKAKEMDALTYLINYEPYELVKLSAGNYCTKTHDSLKLSNGKWYWWSKGIGGRSAVDYLMAVKDLSFYEAVKTICDCSNIPYRLNLTKVKAPAEKKLIIPEKSPDNKRIKRYLKGRGISENVIEYCIENNLIYECESTHAVVFIGSDENDIPRYAGIRSTNKGTRYVGDTAGSDKQYTFRLVGSDSKTVHFFEGSVDLLSYATLLEMQGKDWKQFNLVTLLILTITLICFFAVTAFAADDPVAVVNNFSTFIFGLIRAVGMILLGFGVVQVGLSLKSHDPSQRANGFMTVAGGIVITFAKEILDLIV